MATLIMFNSDVLLTFYFSMFVIYKTGAEACLPSGALANVITDRKTLAEAASQATTVAVTLHKS